MYIRHHVLPHMSVTWFITNNIVEIDDEIDVPKQRKPHKTNQ